jgi:hypothetical protein
VILLQSMAFGAFAEAEPLNPRFSAGHPKMRLTVDSESHPLVPDRSLLDSLIAAFPGLGMHYCQMSASANGNGEGKGIMLLEGEASANQAHLFEHLLLEMLSRVVGVSKLSGVTCAYTAPPERNDVFVECMDPGAGALVGLLALDAMNAALAGGPIAPHYDDALLCARPIIRPSANRAWAPGDLSRASRVAVVKAAAVLERFRDMGVVDPESYAMNFSGEPSYRYVGADRLVSHAAGGGSRTAAGSSDQ